MQFRKNILVLIMMVYKNFIVYISIFEFFFLNKKGFLNIFNMCPSSNFIILMFIFLIKL